MSMSKWSKEDVITEPICATGFVEGVVSVTTDDLIYTNSDRIPAIFAKKLLGVECVDLLTDITYDFIDSDPGLDLLYFYVSGNVQTVQYPPVTLKHLLSIISLLTNQIGYTDHELVSLHILGDQNVDRRDKVVDFLKNIISILSQGEQK